MPNLDFFNIKNTQKDRKEDNDKIAIIGMSVKMPMADDVQEYWQNIRNGVDCVTELPEDRKKDIINYYKSINKDVENLSFLKESYLTDIDKFDYKLFDLSPREAKLMNPHQRLFIQNIYTTLEDAGYGGEKLKGSKTGVFLGFISDLEGYKYKEMIHETDIKSLPVSTVGNLSSIIASRIAYILNLKGPSMLIDTACSSSLVAVHTACKSLLRKECNYAIAGGIKLSLLPIDSEYYKIGIESSDSFTRAFDNTADGSGIGEGVASVLLKPLDKAIKDKDHIYAVIRGSAVNQDGTSMGITAPNPLSHAELYKDAWNDANVNPEEISYIESHGTGTSIGDPIEIEGIVDAFNRYTNKKQFCALGSVKSNIGHLFECSGLAGLVKATMMIKEGIIPPSIHFIEPSKKINFLNSPIYLNTKLKEWKNKKKLCGVSSFGISGTNCHVVLEEYKSKDSDFETNNQPELKENIFTISARSQYSLKEAIKKYIEFINNSDDINLESLCYTANIGRKQYEFRVALTAKNIDELTNKLNKIDINNLNNEQDNYYYGEYKIISDEQRKVSTKGLTIKEKEFNTKNFNEKLLSLMDKDIVSVNEEICKEFIQGTDINWNVYYKNEKIQKINLPTYVFDKKRCWLDFNISDNNSKVLDDSYYKLNWISSENEKNKNDIETYVFIGNTGDKRVNKIIDKLKENDKKVIEVLSGNNSYRHEEVLNNIHLNSKVAIVYDALNYEVENVDKLNSIVFDFIEFAKSILKSKIYDHLNFYLLTSNAHSITKKETINPCSAALIQVGKVLDIESNNIVYKAIDIDNDTENDVIVSEILKGNDYKLVAYRNELRFIPQLDEYHNYDGKDEVQLKDFGVYIITGGTGGIGLEISKYITENIKNPKIILINRSRFPERNSWDKLIEENSNEKLINKIKKIKNIEAMGASVDFISSDVCDYELMKEDIKSIKEKYENINGVIHCAGVGTFKPISKINRDDFDETFNPKVKGTVVLEKSLENEKLDFFILFSSIATLFPAFGQVHYAAANAYIDSYTMKKRLKNKNILSINWTTWNEVGMSYDNKINIDTIFKTISNSEAIRGFDKALRNNASNVVIGKLNYGSDKIKLIDRKSMKLSKKIEEKIEQSSSNTKSDKGNKDFHKKKDLNNKVVLVGKDDGNYTEIESVLANVCSQELGFEEINVYDSFFELGADSIIINKIYSTINEKYPNVVEVVDLFQYSSINKLAEFISQKVDTQKDVKEVEIDETIEEIEDSNDIAIIGIDINVPMAKNIDEFWSNLSNGVNSIVSLPKEREKDLQKYLLHNHKNIDKVKFEEGGYLNDIDKFDYKFFKIAPREADLMDPCQRLFLQNAWKAIEDSGYSYDEVYGSETGVFVGYASNIRDCYGRLFFEGDYLEPASIVGNMQTILANRFSYVMNFTGPSITIDTACSSSLVAVNYACNSILNGECNMAVASGVRLNIVPIKDENATMGIESSDGQTRAFDNKSDGAGFGEGVASIVLKKASQAIKDKDHIYAVIKSSVTNQDGKSNGLTSPNPAAHTRLLKKAWEKAKINPETITYIETHGTGTNLGDPIEVQGIKNAFSDYTDKKQFCAIGSVKNNIGHLFEASGIVNLIKVVLSLNNKKIPPTINLIEPNKKINFMNSPVYVNSKLREWNPKCKIRRAGINAFGFGGTNCHVVLEEYKNKKVTSKEEKKDIFTLSANSKESLINLISEYKEFFDIHKEFNLNDVCYTANVGRAKYKYNLAMIVYSKEDFISKISELSECKDLSNIKNKDIYYGLKAKSIDKNEYAQLKSKAEKVINEIVSNSEQKMRDLCEIFVLGIVVDWNKLYMNQDRRRVRIPTYVFDKMKSWIKYDDDDDEVFETENKKLDSYYKTDWVEYPITNKVDINSDEVIILFNSDMLKNKNFEKNLRNINKNIYTVELGNEFKKIDNYHYVIENTQQDYEKLLESLSHVKISKVIHSFTLDCNYQDIDNVEQLQSCEEKGVYSLYNLMRAINKYELADKAEVILLTINSYEVNETQEIINPHNASLIGMGRVVEEEFLDLKCRAIDIDDNITPDNLIDEIYYKEKLYAISYRDNKRYTQRFIKTCMEDYKDNGCLIKENGTYIIAGGTGGIGLEVAKYLSTNKVNLILLNRSSLPDRKEWETIIEDSNDKKLCNKIDSILAMERNGSKVECFAVNICDSRKMKGLMSEIREKHGSINGIIQCAAVPGAKFIINKSREVFNEVLSPKVYGTWVLDKVTCNDDIDFFVEFSSGLSIMGEAGQADYSAANAYLDAFSEYRNKKNKRTTVIDWVSWKSAGMSVEYGYNVDKLFKTIETDNALDSLSKIIKKDIKQILVGELNYEGEYVYLVDQIPIMIDEKIIESINEYQNKKEVPKKNNSSIKEVKITGIEKDKIDNTILKISNIWSEVLGLQEIDVEDNFYELGGNSILAIKLLRKVECEFGNQVDIQLNDILSLATVNQFANYINKLIEEKKYVNEIPKYKEISSEDLSIRCIPNGMLTSNCYLVSSEDESVLIDCGNSTDKIMEVIKENSLKLKYIIITHAHIDHILSMDEIKKETGASILIYKDEVELLNNCLGAKLVKKVYRLSEEDKLLDNGQNIEFGQATLKVIHTPGHTEGCICLQCGEDILFTGDTLLKDGHGEPDRDYGNKDKLNNSILNLLSNFNNDVVIYPGHGDSSTIGEEKNREEYIQLLSLQRQ